RFHIVPTTGLHVCRKYRDPQYIWRWFGFRNPPLDQTCPGDADDPERWRLKPTRIRPCLSPRRAKSPARRARAAELLRCTMLVLPCQAGICADRVVSDERDTVDMDNRVVSRNRAVNRVIHSPCAEERLQHASAWLTARARAERVLLLGAPPESTAELARQL